VACKQLFKALILCYLYNSFDELIDYFICLKITGIIKLFEEVIVSVKKWIATIDNWVTLNDFLEEKSIK